jgi:hypothetical protein
MDEEGEDEEEEGRLGTSTSNPHRHPKGRMFTLIAIQNQRTRTFNSMIFGFIFSMQLNLLSILILLPLYARRSCFSEAAEAYTT